MADEYQFPMRLRSSMDHAAVVLKNTADSRNRDFDEDQQRLVRRVLEELDDAWGEANLAVCAPATAAQGQRRARASSGLRIRVGHSTAYDFITKLYDVIRGLALAPDVTVSMPHEFGAAGDSTKVFFAEGCDLFIAEVSYPATGLGMEMAYADMYGVPVGCVHRSDCRPSSSVSMVAPALLAYQSPAELAHHVEALIAEARRRKALAAG